MKPKNVLIVDCSFPAVGPIVEFLREIELQFTVIEFSVIMKSAADTSKVDIIILCTAAGEGSNTALITEFLGQNEELPIIIISNSNNDEFREMLFRKGIQDYLLIDELKSSALEKSIQYALYRKNAEIRKLFSMEKLFGFLYNDVPVMHHSIDKNGTLISVSNYWLAKLGYEKEEVLGKKSTDFLTEESRRKAVEQILPEFFKSGHVENAEYGFIKKNGETITCLLNALSLKDKNGNFVRSVAVITDISDLKKVQLDLERNRQAYKSLFDHNPDGVYAFDLNGVFKSANSSLARMADCTIEELLRTTFFSLIVPEDLERVFDHFWKAARGEPQKYEAAMISTKGRKFFVNVSNIPMVIDGEIVGVFGVAKDITVRKIMQKELSESELKFRSVLHSAPDAVFLTDEKMQIIYCNQSAKELFGFEEKELLGAAFKILFTPESISAFPARTGLVCPAEDDDSRKVLELTTVAKDGRKIPVEHTVSCWKTDQVKTYCFFLRDISEKKKAADKFQTIIKTISDGFCIVGVENGEILEVNDSFCKMTGFPRKELLKMKASDLEAIDSKEEFKAHMKKVMENGYDRFETKHRTKSGLLLDVNVIITFSSVEKNRFIAFIHDITEHKKMAATLQRSETNLRAIFENTNTGFLLLDRNLNLLSFNKRGAELAKKAFNRDLEANHPLPDFLPEYRKESINAICQKVLNGETVNYEVQYPQKNKHPLCLEINCKPVICEGNNVIGISYAVSDITERKKSEEKLVSINKELETFIYKASHDLRSPLASILGVITVAKHEIETANANIYFDMIHTLAKKLDDTLLKLVQSLFIDDTRGFSDQINFIEIIKEALQKLGQNPGFNKIKIKYDVKTHLEFNSNRFIIESIFQNMIANAIKYQKQNSNSAFLNIKIRSEKNKIAIIFEDNGIGIENKYQQRIFDMYFRATDISSGSGLGLYIVKKGVEKLGGSISVESEIRVGSTFRIVLPVKTSLTTVDRS